MSSVQNNNGVTINFYNAPPPTDMFVKQRGLSVDYGADDDSDFDLGDDGGSASAFDNLPLPAWAKAALRNLFGGADANLPSSSDAAKTLRDFQRNEGINLLSSEQVQQMADTGYCTKPNGERELVPPEVQLAAQKMMANNGELFKKLETAIRPEHDGLLSAADYDAALKDGSIGKPGTADLPTMQGLDPGAFLKFVMDGTLSPNRPSEYNAAKTIQGFQQERGIEHLSVEQMQQMASTGYCTSRDGKNTFQVPPDVQAAAQKMMENNGELFKKLETAIRVNPDGLLSKQDADTAINNGLLNPYQSDDDAGMVQDQLNQYLFELQNRPDSYGDVLNRLERMGIPNNDGGNGMPSSSDAAKTLHDFQGQQGIPLLSSEQVQQMATTGYCTKPDGQTIQVPPEVQAAAMKAMENNGQLFKQLESAVTGDFDGLLAQQDYHEALDDGTIGQPSFNGVNGGNPTGQNNFNGAQKSDFGALSTMQEFHKGLGNEMLSRDKLQQMADTGKLTKDNGVTMDVSPEVQASARTLLANNGALFDKLEVAHNGKKDGLIAKADYPNAINQSIKDATGVMADFQKSEMNGDFMTRAKMQEIADTGMLTKDDGSRVQVPQNVIDAARAYMDNDAKLFKEAESVQDGKHDDKLSVKDSRKRGEEADD